MRIKSCPRTLIARVKRCVRNISELTQIMYETIAWKIEGSFELNKFLARKQ